MSLRIWLALLLACLLNEVCGQTSSPQCSDPLARELANKLDENKRIVMESLVNTFSGLGSNKTAIDAVYKALSKKFSRSTTTAGYDHFVESLNMISAKYYHEAQAANQYQSQDIPTLAQHFNAAYGTKNSIELCDIFGRILYYKDHTDQNRERRNSDVINCAEYCDCPAGGISSTEVLCPCQFFDCLDDGRNLMPVFEGFVGLECLAFVLDTTGSMKDEIDATLQVIKDFIAASAELGCYMLVPFNDYGSSNISVGPVTLTFVEDEDPNSPKSLQTLHSNLENAFQKKSGGDCPEYCYDGIMEALNAQDGDWPVMTFGSQLMVITDAPSKGLTRATDIVTRAYEAGVCVHFFLGANSYNCFDDHPGSIEEYEAIAKQTDGTVIKTKFDFSVFVQQYRNAPCGFLQSFSDARKKRSIEQVCHTFNVSSLVCWLSLSVRTQDDVVTLTKPNGTQVRTESNWFRGTTERVALYSESRPAFGQYTVCASTPIQLVTSFQFCIDIAPFYVMHTEGGSPVLTATAAPACTLAHSVLVSTRCAEVSSPVLYMLNREGSVALESPLETCDSSMSANITMPVAGNYYYKLGGRDTAGNSIDHLITRRITVPLGDDLYNLTGVGPEAITVLSGQVAIIRFTLTSRNPHGSMTFSFTLAEQDLQHQISPSQYTLAYGQSVNVTVHIRPMNSHEVELVAFNECFTLNASTRVTIVQPPTTAPAPSECNPPCLNGGTCTAIRRRSRVFHVCRCASPNYYGRRCENTRN